MADLSIKSTTNQRHEISLETDCKIQENQSLLYIYIKKKTSPEEHTPKPHLHQQGRVLPVANQPAGEWTPRSCRPVAEPGGQSFPSSATAPCIGNAEEAFDVSGTRFQSIRMNHLASLSSQTWCHFLTRTSLVPFQSPSQMSHNRAFTSVLS